MSTLPWAAPAPSSKERAIPKSRTFSRSFPTTAGSQTSSKPASRTYAAAVDTRRIRHSVRLSTTPGPHSQQSLPEGRDAASPRRCRVPEHLPGRRDEPHQVLGSAGDHALAAGAAGTPGLASTHRPVANRSFSGARPRVTIFSREFGASACPSGRLTSLTY